MSFTIVEGREEDFRVFCENSKHDKYDDCVVKFALSWGRKMEDALDAGNCNGIQEIYDLRKEADMYSDLTRDMFLSAAAVLACFWEYGYEFNYFHYKHSVWML